MSNYATMTNSSPPQTTLDNRLKRDRSYRSGAHNGSISKSIKTTEQQGKNSVSVTHPQQNGIPLFLQKTYQMISECDSILAEWTPGGESFVVKDPTQFAKSVIPTYFDHSKFSSFARQLNFYGFHKVQARPVRNTDVDKSKEKHVTFRNENFKRDRQDLLSNIQRSTRGGGNATNLQQQQRQIDSLKAEVNAYETQVAQLSDRMNSMDKKFSDLLEQMKLNQPQHVQRRNCKVEPEPDEIYSTENPRIRTDVEYISRQMSSTSLTGDIFDKGARKLQPTLNPHPKAKNNLPPSSVQPLFQEPSSLSLGDSGYILDGLTDAPGDTGNGMASKSSRKPSQPTLKPHPKAKNNLPPSDVPPLSQGPRLQSLSLGISDFRGLSNESFQFLEGMDNFEKGLFKTLVLDESDHNCDGTEPIDSLWTTSAQDV